MSGWYAPAGFEVFALNEHRSVRFHTVVDANLGPEGEWNCLEIVLAGTGLRVITPNDQSGDPKRETEVLTLTSLIVGEYVLPSAGVIGALLADGTIAAMELDIYGEDDPTSKPGTGEHLATLGKIQALDENDELVDVGVIYFYTAAQFAARVDYIETAMGSPLIQKEIWVGPVMQSVDEGPFSTFLLTSDTAVHGELVVDGTFRLMGNGDWIPELIRYGIGHGVRGSGHQLGGFLMEPAPIPLPALPNPPAHYAALAVANGTFFNQDLKVVAGLTGIESEAGIPLEGVVYCTGDVVIEDDAMVSILTIIAEGSIEVAGQNNELEAAVDGILFWSIDDGFPKTENSVVIAGASNRLTGRMFAPGGQLELLGGGARIVGNLCAGTILVSGDDHTISDGTKQ